MNKKRYAPVVLTLRTVLYVILLAAAFSFAQLVRYPVAYMTFLFVLLLPIITAAYLITAAACVRVTLRSPTLITKKAAPVEVFFKALNKSPLPFSLIHVYMSSWGRLKAVPDTECTVLSLMPFSHYSLSRSMEFPFLGEYPVSIEAVYVYDIFGAVGVRVPCRGELTVTVIPGCPRLPDSKLPPKSTGMHTRADAVSAPSGSDTADIRAYEMGDSTKHIHWKLSSKSEELIVRQMTNDSLADTVILCDLETASKGEAPFEIVPEKKDMAERTLSDMVIEGAVGAAHRELAAGRTVSLGYITDGECTFRRLGSTSELEALKPELALLLPTDTEDQLAALYKLTEDKGSYPVFISAAPYTDRNLECITSASRSAGGVQLINCMDSSLFIKTDAYTEKCRQSEALLFDGGVDIIRMEKYISQKAKYKA